MKALLLLYLNQAHNAGYVVRDTEHPLVLVDRDTFLHIVLADEDGGYMVGRWYKTTLTRSGGYSSHPDMVESSLEDCLKYVRDWSAL